MKDFSSRRGWSIGKVSHRFRLDEKKEQQIEEEEWTRDPSQRCGDTFRLRGVARSFPRYDPTTGRGPARREQLCHEPKVRSACAIEFSRSPAVSDTGSRHWLIGAHIINTWDNQWIGIRCALMSLVIWHLFKKSYESLVMYCTWWIAEWRSLGGL